MQLLHANLHVHDVNKHYTTINYEMAYDASDHVTLHFEFQQYYTVQHTLPTEFQKRAYSFYGNCTQTKKAVCNIITLLTGEITTARWTH